MKNHKHPPGRREFLKTPQLEDKMYLYLLKVLVNHFTCYLIHLSGSSKFYLSGLMSKLDTIIYSRSCCFCCNQIDENIIHWSDYLSLRCYLKRMSGTCHGCFFSKPPIQTTPPLGETSALQPAWHRSRRQIPPPNSSTVDWSAWVSDGWLMQMIARIKGILLVLVLKNVSKPPKFIISIRCIYPRWESRCELKHVRKDLCLQPSLLFAYQYMFGQSGFPANLPTHSGVGLSAFPAQHQILLQGDRTAYLVCNVQANRYG